MDLGSLTQGQTPPNVATSTTTSTQLPAWLQDYERGIAGKGLSIANQGYQAYPGQRLAGFTPDQQSAFQQIRSSQGNWSPDVNRADSLTTSVVPNVTAGLSTSGQYGGSGVQMAQSAGAGANAAVAGPAQGWTDNWQQYMSPYTDSVVNEIGRLGNQNLMENIIPAVQNQFIGSGGFGSTRNADMLGRSIRDAQTNITGQQSQALQSGYNNGASIFGADAGRQQQQQQMQAQTALGAGSLGSGAAMNAGNMALQGTQIGANADLGAAQQLGALGQLRQNMAGTDAQRLGSVGSMQQQLQQQGLDIGYQDFQNQRDWDKNNLTFLNGLVKGLPVQSTSTTNGSAPLPGASYGASPLQYLNAGVGLWNNMGAPSGSTLAQNNAGWMANNPGMSYSDLQSAG